MRKSYREVNGEKVFRYSIRKYHFGAASVAVAALMFFANGAVKADTLPVSPATANTEKVNVGVTELTEGVPPKENPIEKSKEEVVGDKTPVAQKLVDKSPLVQAISELQAAIAKVDEESLVSLSNQLIQLTDENNRLLNGENISEEAIASQVSRVQFLTEQVRQLKSKTEDKASNKEDRSGSKVQDKKEFEVSENAVTLVNQTAEIKKSVKDVKVEEVFTNKTKLETLLKEIDKLDPEKYTEDSVKGLKEKVAKAKEVLTIANNQEEVNSVYKELVNYKNSSLRRVKTNHKPLEENTPKLDTTNGKETVGKKAQNTEPNDRNIAGHNHSMNGTSLPEGSGLRTAPKPELADVQIGRWNGTRRTFDRSNVFVTPANQGIVGNVMKIKAISASDNFTNIEVTGNQGFPLQVKKKINGKEAELYFEGNTPSNGSWNMTVTATTAKGTKSFNFGYYTALRKPTILTQNTALEGKAKEKPTIEVEVPTFSPAPTGSKFKVYLVRGGSTNGWDNSGNAYPSGYSVLASADVVASTGGKGTAIINASNYRVSELGTTAFKAITVIELNGRENDTDPGERGSWFSDERRATERLANKSALTAALSDETTTKGTPAYYNAEASKKTAYDNAVAAGKVVLAKDNATQTEVDNAVSAITNAKNALGGRPTNKGALQTATSTGDTTTKGTPAYYNAEASKKTAYDNAVAAGKVVLAKDNATQTEVNNALSAITTAKNALGGNATNKDALQTATSTGDTETKATPAYYNAEASKKTAYDNAVTAGKVVLAKDNATQTEVNNALSAITTAKNALGGNATNKDALQTATSTGDTETKASATYYNAEASKKTAYDNAVAAGKVVLAKDNATQTEVNNALSAIITAKNALGGNATNKDALQTATSTGDTETKASAAYYNAEASKKTAYDNAVVAGKVVLAKDNATQTEVNNALSAIITAKEKLDGAPFPTEIEKSNAIAEVKKALDTKIKSIESSKEFTDNDKGILKDKAEKAAMAAIVRIKTATTNAAVETAKIEGIERINSIEANLPATLDFPEFTGEVNGEIVEPTETLKEEQGGENKPQPASVVLSDDTTREPEVVTSNSQPVSSENNVPKQNDSKSHAALPNTGTKEDRATGSLGVLSLLGAFGLLFAKKKKDDEEEA